MAQLKFSVIIVNYNTCDITLDCLRSVYEQTQDGNFEVILVDNDSADDSVDKIRESFPQVDLIESSENLGFAAANNLAAERASGEYLLLLNSDTVVLDKALEKIVAFADSNPDNKLWGGRTLFEDKSLNRASCWGSPTAWSMFCRASGLSSFFRNSSFFDPESCGPWKRDTVREVDIISGCFFLMKKDFWQELGGFDKMFFMYAEDADLSLRAGALGARPLICPEAEIIHYGGKSERTEAGMQVKLLRARNQLIGRHWPTYSAWFGMLMHKCWCLRQLLLYKILSNFNSGRFGKKADSFAETWRRRDEWQDGK